MKKMLTLVLVLAVTSLASATLVSPIAIVDNLDGTYALDFTAGLTVALDGPSGGMFALIGADSVDAAVNAAVVGNGLLYDGAMAFMTDSAELGMGAGVVGGITITGTMVDTGAGIYLDGYKALPGVTQFQLLQLDDNAAPTGVVIATYNIPEPVTMSLLGLGALFLRRKK